MAKYVILYIMISLFSENFRPKKDQKKIHVKMEIVNIGKVVALFCNVDKILYTLLYDLCECDKGQGHKDKEDNFWCHVFLSLATELDCV